MWLQIAWYKWQLPPLVQKGDNSIQVRCDTLIPLYFNLIVDLFSNVIVIWIYQHKHTIIPLSLTDISVMWFMRPPWFGTELSGAQSQNVEHYMRVVSSGHLTGLLSDVQLICNCTAGNKLWFNPLLSFLRSLLCILQALSHTDLYAYS